MEVDLPFKAEYSKSGRASCKGCKTKINQSDLRIAVMVQSAFHDGKQPNWYHETCFFTKHRPTSAGDVANFENLRFEDQERIQKEIESCSTVIVGKKKGSKRSKEESNVIKDFGVEYAKSGRAVCCGCHQKILKNQVRIRKTVYDTEVGMKYGGQPLWHHVDCFAQLRGELGWFDTGENLPGYNDLKNDDQIDVKKILPIMKNENLPATKKAKTELDGEDEKLSKELIETIKKQSSRLFKFRDTIKNEMRKNDMLQLLEDNNQEPIKGDSEKLLDQVSDLLAFGALLPCPECNGSQLLFQKSGYLCNGQLTEWTKCTNLIKEPKRKPCIVSKNLKSEYGFLKDVRKAPEARAFRYIPPSAATISKNLKLKKEDELDGPKIKREVPPLHNMEICVCGFQNFEDIKERITKLGGKCTSSISKRTTAVLSTLKEIQRMSSQMKKAKNLELHVIPIDYLDAVESNAAAALNYITSMSLCDWGTDPAPRIQEERAKSSKSSSKSIYTKSVPKSMTLKIKDGVAVDPESGLEDVAHVYISQNKDKFNVVLGITDIQSNKNSYYKIQLLESDNKNNYWVFRSWGRIGTTIGGNKLEKFNTVLDAKKSFKDLYLEKSGNHFDNRNHFVKVSGRMYPIDIDYGNNAKIDLSAEHKVKSKLHQSVQDIIKLMFDIDSMKRTMIEFDLDMEKMPLGKLSQKQIQAAYKVLTEIYELIRNNGSKVNFIDATNRFYTLIPHNFGTQSAPLLDTNDQIEKLREMLDSLLEIECAYSLLQAENVSDDVNPIDKHYEQLKTNLEPVDKNSKEFSLLQQYVQNTHAATHNMYELEIIDIFKVARQGENRRYKPFKKLHNRRLLWHGSRLTNFAGILSHGLKIAPPEAPVTGYMFGKGIYFADMVSKSANYCCTSRQNSTGLMLLSEVALGDMVEYTAANYVTKLPNDKHSCFGRGSTMPDPHESVIREDGVEIPLGKPIINDNLKTSLLYNEFIVYDIAQVNIQYLFRMNFKYT